jgi:5-methylcytosine-specific restriction endonuclease McrA
MYLSAADAMRKLDTIDLEEKNRVAEGIALIAVIDHRKDYLGAGYPCMLDYCMGRLHMSQPKALRRIQVARAALEFPDVFEYLANGRLSVTSAAELAPHLETGTAAELLAAVAFRSKEEIRRILAERAQSGDADASATSLELVVETTSDSYAPAHTNSLVAPPDPSAPATEDPAATAPAPEQPKHLRRGRVSPSDAGGYEVRLSITEDEHDDLRQAQTLLGHAVPSGDPALVYARAMKHYVAQLEKQRLGVRRTARSPKSRAPAQSHGASRGRRIPRALYRQVWERDGGRCAFVSADGHRCGGTVRLEVDHIRPVAQGGERTLENLRLLCRAHNQHEAERVLGKEQVQRAKELAQRARATTKAAKRAVATKTRAREAAKHRHHDDILAALGGLGFHRAEALRGADLAAAMPDASLEECVRHALASLTRAVATRGERRARCTA